MTLFNSIWFFSSPLIEIPLLQISLTRGFSPVCIGRYSFQVIFLEKSFIAYFTKYKFFPGNAPLGYLSGKMHCLKFHKHEAFYLYVSRNEYTSGQYVKILSCILLKHEAYHLYLSKDEFTSGLFPKIFSYIFHRQCLCQKMLLQVTFLAISLVAHFTNRRLSHI